MGYTDKIECPHCHRQFEVEVDIEGYGDDAYAGINPIEPTEVEWQRETIGEGRRTEISNIECDFGL